jgi:hypothetical protein
MEVAQYEVLGGIVPGNRVPPGTVDRGIASSHSPLFRSRCELAHNFIPAVKLTATRS